MQEPSPPQQLQLQQQQQQQQQQYNPAGVGPATSGPSDPGGSPEPDGDAGQAGDKPLTSRFRGVCWNKKNRRWQAAINSSGKYLYLGSFLGEEDAARAFDRAAIRLRGNRAKLNFTYSDYTDEAGQLIEDSRLSAVLSKVEGKGGNKDVGDSNDGGAQHGAASGRHRVSATLAYVNGGGLGGSGNSDWHPKLPPLSSVAHGLYGHQHHLSMQQQQHLHLNGSNRGGMGGAAQAAASAGHHSETVRAALYAGGLMPGGPNAPRPGHLGGGGTGGASVAGGGLHAELRLPPNCTVNSVINGEDDTFGVVYVNSASHQVGSAVWDGLDLHDLGLYDSEKDARQACLSTMRIVLSHKRAAEATGNLYGSDRHAVPGSGHPGASYGGFGGGAGGGGGGGSGGSDLSANLAHHFGGGGAGISSSLDSLALLQNDKAASALLLGMAGSVSAAPGGGGFDNMAISFAHSLGSAGLFGPHSVGANALHGREVLSIAGGNDNGQQGASSSPNLPPVGATNAANYHELFQWLSAFTKEKQSHQNAQLGLDQLSGAAALLAGASRPAKMGSSGGGGGAAGGDETGGGTKRGVLDNEETAEDVGGSKKARNSNGVSQEFAAMTKLGNVRLADALKALIPPQALSGSAEGCGGGDGNGPR